MNSTKFNIATINNAVKRQGVDGKQGIRLGAKGSKPDKLKPFSDNFYKKKKEMENKPTKFKPQQIRENTYNASTVNMRGKRTDRDFNKTQPIRFDPLAETSNVNKVGNASYNAGAFRGGEPNREIGTYEKKRGDFKTMVGGDYGKTKNVIPFPIKIKSTVSV